MRKARGSSFAQDWCNRARAWGDQASGAPRSTRGPEDPIPRGLLPPAPRARAWQPVGALASLLAVAITVAYALTAPRWHLDARGDAGWHGAARPISVQLAVLVQLACTAVGVGAFHRLSTRAFDAH